MKNISLILTLLVFIVVGCHGGADNIAQIQQPVAATISKHYDFHDFDTVALAKAILQKDRISIAYPVDWIRTTESGLWVCKAPYLDTTSFRANYVVNSIPQKPGVNLEAYGSYFISEFEKRPDVKYFSLIGDSSQVINGLPARIIDYKCALSKKEIGSTMALLQSKGNIITINFGASNYPSKSYIRYRGLYERIIQSVKAN